MPRNKQTADQTANQPADDTDIFADAEDLAANNEQRQRDAAEELELVADADPTSADADRQHDDQPAATDTAEQRSIFDGDDQPAASQTSGQYHNAPVTDAEAAGGDGTFFLDMAAAEEKIVPMVAGTRLVVSCTAAEAKLSASGGNPMIAVRVKAERVVSVPDVTIDTSAYKNRSVRDNLIFTGPNPITGSKGQLWRCKLAFEAFGVEWPREVFRSKADFMAMLARKAEELIGAVCEIEVGIDANDGSNGQKIQIDTKTGEAYGPKNTIARYYPYTPVARQTVEEDLPF